MALKTSLYAMMKITQVHDSIVTAADTTCAGVVDMQGCEECVFLTNIGLEGDSLDSSNFIELELEHSDTTTDGDYEDIPDAQLANYVTGTNHGTYGVIDGAADDNTTYITAYKGIKRYIRQKLAFTGTHSTGTSICVTAIQKSSVQPVNEYTV